MSRVEVRLDLIREVTTIGELAKAAAKFGYVMELGYGDDDNGANNFVRLTSAAPNWLRADIAQLLYLEAMATNRSIDTVLAGVRREFEQRHFPIDVPPEDAAGIGEGHRHDEGG